MEREMKESGIPWIGLIPEDWNVCKIKNITTVFNGNSLNDSQKEYFSLAFDDDCYPYISTKDVQLDIDKINYDNGLKIPKKDCSFSIAPKESTLLCIEGGSAGKKVGFISQDVCFVNKLCCFHSNQNNRFIFYFILSHAFGESFAQNIQGLIGGVSISTIKNIYTILPPLSTQQSIANFLDRKCAEIDELAELQETMIAELKKYKQSVITEAVTKGLNKNVPMKDSGVEWIGEIPCHWEKCTVKQIMRNKSLKGYPNEQVLSLYRDWGVVPKDSRDDNHNVTSEDTASYKLVDVGDFVINKMKAWQGSMAVSNYRGIISPAYYICSFVNENIFRRYFHYLLRNETYKVEYRRLSTGLRIGQWDLNIDDFLNIPIVVPPLSEQKAIADYLDTKCAEIDELIAIKQQKLEALKEFKKSIIFEYVTGKKEVME